MPVVSDTHLRSRLARAIASHVPFDGWGQTAFAAACADCGISQGEGRAVAPRGAVDLAAELHRMGDAQMAEAFASADLAGLRYSEKVAHAIWLRIEAAGDKEVVRRATALFALPGNAATGAVLVWETADAIWCALGDTSRDINWYSKRAILSAVYGSCVLYWLGDTGEGQATRAFIDRRIADVMRFERFKSEARASKALGPIAQSLARLTEGVVAPGTENRARLPGYINPRDFR